MTIYIKTIIVLISTVALFASACHTKTDVSVNNDSLMQKNSHTSLVSDCQLIVNFADKGRNYREDNSSHKLLFLGLQNNTYNEKTYRAYVMKIKNNRFIQLTSKEYVGRELSQDDFTNKKTLIDDDQRWYEIIAHPLWKSENVKDVVMFKRENELISPSNDINKQKYMRHKYKEIHPATIPLKGDTNFYDSIFFFVDNRYVLSMYDNVVYVYDGFLYANRETSCYPNLWDDESLEHGCSSATCITYATAAVLDFSDDEQLIFKTHRSIRPEYYDGESFSPIFETASLNDWDGIFVKKQSGSSSSTDDRTFAFSPFPLNIVLNDDEKPFYGISLISPKIGSDSDQAMDCRLTYYETWPQWDLDSGEQSIIYGIPYEKAPDTVKPIIDRITRAPNGCGEIDWKNQELLFGDRRFPAPWLKEDIAGIYWLEPGEEFPIDRLVPDTTVEYIDWDK